MEFRTTQGGETTLVFDEGETLQLEAVGRRLGMNLSDVVHQMTAQRQAHPLDNFDQLLAHALPQIFSGGVVAPDRKSRRQPPVDPSVELEQHIRRRLAAGTAGPIGTTSQSQQAEAILLQALAICLQSQMLREMLARFDQPVMVRAVDGGSSVHG